MPSLQNPESVTPNRPFSGKDFYDKAVAALLRKELPTGHHDGFRVGGRLFETSETQSGRWTLTDKYSYESSAYDLSVGSHVSATEQRRLQRAGKSILYLQLSDERQRSLGYYHSFWPQELRPGTELHQRMIYNHPEDDPDFVIDYDALDMGLYHSDEVVDPFPVAQWADGQPRIYAERGISSVHFVTAVTEPHTDPYLAQVYKELSFR